MVFGLSVTLWATLFSYVQAESIELFDVDIVITENGTVAVNETIVYDFGSLERHGIFREVLDAHAQESSAWYKERYVKLRPVAVTRNGEIEPFTNEASSGLYLRIGDANKTITGRHEYQITYIAEGALSQVGDGIELYWNVTGDEWQIPINKTQVNLSVNNPGRLGVDGACYAGSFGANAACENLSYRPLREGRMAVFSQDSPLSPGEQLTIAHEVELTQPAAVHERLRYILIIPIVLIIWFVGLIVYAYRWKTHYKRNSTIIARYTPYAGFKPLFSGVLVDNKLDARDITAGILSLAEQGFLSIRQTTEKALFFFETHDYVITLEKPFESASTRFEQDLLSLIFANQASVFESDTKGLARLREKRLHRKQTLGVLSVGKTVKLSEIKKNTQKRKENTKTLKALRKSIVQEMVKSGFLEQRLTRATKGGYLAGLTIFTVFALQFMVALPIVFLFALLLSFPTLLILLVSVTERRTEKGYEAMQHLKGFKDFLSVTEKDRYEFHNAPSKSPAVFMKYLPYAIAFGVEKEWAEVFKDITIASPDWYQSDVPGAQFSAVSFGKELSSFSNSFSTSSGSSGSSGGGSAGGGGGGGGGGSW